MIMNREYDLTGRMSLNQDRFIFQFPQCSDMDCGKSGDQIKEAINEGCMIRPGGNKFIMADRGSITYPQNGSVYDNKKSCIWQIRPETPNKHIKFRIVNMDTEYDQYCGMDKLHVYTDTPEKFGGKDNKFKNRVARVCGGAEERGPKFQRKNFFDATGRLKRFGERSGPNQCPVNERNDKPKKCQIEGHREFYAIDHEIMTIVFESDRSGRNHHGFTIEWEVYDSKKPTPPPPAEIKYPYLYDWIEDKLVNNRYGIFTQAKMFVVCPADLIEKKQCHNRYKINKANDARIRFKDARQQVQHSQNYHPRGCVRDTDLVPKPFEELRELALVDPEWKNKHPKSLENMLDFWLKTQQWRLAKCTSSNAHADIKQAVKKFNAIMTMIRQEKEVFNWRQYMPNKV